MADDKDTPTADHTAQASAAAEPQVEKVEGADVPSTAEDRKPDAAEAKEASPAEEASESKDAAQAPEQTGEPLSEDVEMKDATEDTEAQGAVPNGAPVTPAGSKKATANGSSKKKSSGVPEHKTKKLNRKKSKIDLHLHCEPGELYLARMKGHPAWPSIICDEELLPASLATTRPVTTALPDGTFKKPEYADGGKRAHERTFPIMFLYTNEFAWMPNTDLAPITAEDCREVSEKGKTKALLEAYRVAGEEHDLAYFKKVLNEHQEAVNEDNERRAEREAKKAEKAERARRKSEAAANDEMDIDEEDEEAPSKPKSKKRKKSLDADDEDEKPAKTPKTATKLKLNAPKTPTSESSKKKTPAKTKSASKKQSSKTANTEEAANTPVAEERVLTPAEAKDKREKEIKYYRHKLQKGFLSRDDVPSDEETTSMSTYLAKLEGYPDLEGSIIRATKIHKVLKAMIKLPSIPKDDVFNFKKRSMDLLVQWNPVLTADEAGGSGSKDEDKQEKADEKAEENGDKKDEEIKTNGVAAEVEPEAHGALADEDEEGTDSKIGTAVEGEKEAEKAAEGDDTEDKATDAPEADFKPGTETAEATEATA